MFATLCLHLTSIFQALLGLGKTCIIFIIICLSVLLLVYSLPIGRLFQLHMLDSQQKKTLPTWTVCYWPFGQSSSLDGDVCWNLFSVPGCKELVQRSYSSSADVVVFHNSELVNGPVKLPLNLPGPQGQSWAWLTLESPLHNGNMTPFSNIFNITVTYRRNSDVDAPYGELQLRSKVRQPVEHDPPKNWTSFSCRVFSNQQNHHHRNKMYNEFKESILVDELATVEDLAEYLKQVAKGDKRYEEYFAGSRSRS